MFLDWVEKMPLSDVIKDKFRALTGKMPSTSLRSVIKNCHKYVLRFETETQREMLGLPKYKQIELPPEPDEKETFIAEVEQQRILSSWDDDEITLNTQQEEKNGNEGQDNEKEASQEAGPTEVVHFSEHDHTGQTQSGPAPNSQQSTDQLHAPVSDGGLGLLRPRGELPAGHKQPEEGGDPSSADRDD